jgi:fatty-acyl-CoA synthase
MDSPSKAWLRALQATASIQRGAVPLMPLAVDAWADRSQDAVALATPTAALTYRALAQATHRIARWALGQGLTAGDVVCLFMHNSLDYLPLWLGLTRVGVTVSLLNTNLTGEALAHCIKIVNARCLIVGNSLCEAARSARPHLDPSISWWVHGAGDSDLPRMDLAYGLLSGDTVTAAECRPPALEDHALYIYTSGTTGLPKAANVSHVRLLQWTHWFAALMNVTPEDRMYNCLPMYHSIGGVVASGAPLVGGGAVVIRERFSARHFWPDVVQERCTLFQYIGELCRYLVAAPPQPEESRHSLRVCCGNGLRADVWEEFKTRFRIPQILEYYAATEGSFSLYNCEGRPGAIGKIPTMLAHRMQVALVRVDEESGMPRRNERGHCERCAPQETGEALGLIAGADGTHAGRFEGYADREASEKKVLRDVFESGDAWYRTGDLMRQDAEGFFYFVDRVGDTFRWKGENVSTAEVAAVISGCSGISDAAVYGVSVPGSDGRAGMAAVVVSSGFDLRTLRRHLEALPEYGRPQFLRLVPAIELTGTFRLRKQELARQGYDPAKIADPLYYNNRAQDAYQLLDATQYARIQAGQLRF